MIKAEFISLDKINKQINRKNFKIILCHGVFDVIHLGHLKYFEYAKNFCKSPSKLVVSLTSDHFVKKSKGFNRPFFNLKHRINFLKYINCIDYICVSNNATALDVINKTKPDYYAKGPDYNSILKKKIDPNLLKEISQVKKFGGEFLNTKGITFSSSNILYNYYGFLDEEKNKFLKLLKKKYTKNYLEDLFFNLKKPNVLILGESIIDQYVFTETLGKSSKEAILNTKILNTENYLGGVLVVANHLSQICNKIKIITYLGKNDKINNIINKKLNKKINIEYIFKKNSPTIVKKRYVDKYSSTKLFGSYNINDNLISSAEENFFLKKIKRNIKKYDLVLLINYNHGLITNKILNFVKNNAKFLALNNQLNSSNNNTYSLDLFNYSDLLCVQELEARSALRMKHEKTTILLKNLFKSKKNKNLIITCGKNGSFYKNKNQEGNTPAFAENIVDRVGAGDLFFLTAAFFLWHKTPLDLVNFISNISASFKIKNIGNSYHFKIDDLQKKIFALLK